MHNEVDVSWGETAKYRFELRDAQPMDIEAARAWFDAQFKAFDCEIIRSVGKVLSVDKVLTVAQAAGEDYFSKPEHREWAMNFARATSALLGRPVVRVDVPSLTIGY